MKTKWKYIVAYALLHNMTEGWIKRTVALAAKHNAPKNVVYYTKWDGGWASITECHPGHQKDIKRIVKYLK